MELKKIINKVHLVKVSGVQKNPNWTQLTLEV